MTDEARIDTAALVREIQAEVARRKAAGEYPDDLLARLHADFSDEDEPEAPEALAVVESSRPLRSARRAGPAILFGKRVTRRLLAWYVAPIAQDQTRFNLALLRELRAMESRLARVETPLDHGPGVRRDVVALDARRQAVIDALAGCRGAVGVAGDVEIAEGLRTSGIDVASSAPDPFTVLERVTASTLGAVVLGGVLAKLSPAELLAVIPLARRALRPGGLLLADTPKPPESMTDPSAVDPAMVRWVHPQTMAILCEANGLEGHRVVDVGAVGAATWCLHSARRPAG